MDSTSLQPCRLTHLAALTCRALATRHRSRGNYCLHVKVIIN